MNHFHPGWIYLDELTPIQNQWMEWYIRPSCTVVFPAWARNQPKDFRLDYLLRYALDHQWELTPAGWTKAQELGLMDGLEKQPKEIGSDEEWGISNGKAAKRFHEWTFKKISFNAAKTMLTRKVQSGEIATNGKSGRNLRLSLSDVDALILKVRNVDVDLNENPENANDFDKLEDLQEEADDAIDMEDDEYDWYKF